MEQIAENIQNGMQLFQTGEFRMTSIVFWSASALASVWLVVHLFIGGRQIARPLIDTSELSSIVKHTQYLCWHFTTVAIAGMATFFGLAALSGIVAYATSATALAFGFFLVGVGLTVSLGESHARLPQGWLFLPVAVLGLAGHIL